MYWLPTSLEPPFHRSVIHHSYARGWCVKRDFPTEGNHLFIEALGGKRVDGGGQDRRVLLGNGIGAVRLVTTRNNLNVVVSVRVGSIAVLVGSAGTAVAAAVIVVVMVTIASDVNDLWITLAASAAADKAAKDTGGSVENVTNDVAVAVARRVKEAVDCHLGLLHHVSLLHHLCLAGLLSLFLDRC